MFTYSKFTKYSLITMVALPMTALSLSRQEVRNAVIAQVDAVGEELTHFINNFDEGNPVPGNEVFYTTTKAIASYVHTPSDNVGGLGAVTYTLNGDSGLLSGSTIVYNYRANNGVILGGATCVYTQNGASIDIEAARLDPDGVTTINLFPDSSYSVTQSCSS